MPQDRFDLRSEDKLSIGNGVVKWFDAYAIPGEDEQLAALVPDRKSEHPEKLMDEFEAVFLIRVQDALSIGS
jgi:hypothetical protein